MPSAKRPARKSPATKRAAKKAGKKVGEVMHEFKEGELRSSSGEKVTDRKQAIAIGLSEAREAEKKSSQRKARSSKSGKT